MLVALQAHANGIILSGKLGPGGMALPGTSGGSAFVVPTNPGLIALHKTSQTAFWSQIFIWNARPQIFLRKSLQLASILLSKIS